VWVWVLVLLVLQLPWHVSGSLASRSSAGEDARREGRREEHPQGPFGCNFLHYLKYESRLSMKRLRAQEGDQRSQNKGAEQ